MRKKKKSAAGRLFYTFGSIFFAAVVAVCAFNFAKDGRAFQTPVLSADSGTSTNKGTSDTAKTSQDYETLKYNAASSETANKTAPDTSSKTTSDSKSTEDKSTAASDTKAQPTVAADP